jgi:hypothetical protein
MTDHDVIPIPASELSTLRRNAARYLWLRDDIADSSKCLGYLPECLNAVASPSEMDEAIDAAMQANK